MPPGGGQPPYGGGPSWPGQGGGWNQPPKKSKGPMIAIIIVVVVVVLAAAGVGGWAVFGRGGGSTHADPTPSPTHTSASPSPTSESPSPSESPSASLPGGDAVSVQEGQCVKNEGTSSNPNLKIVDCGPGTYKVLKKFRGTHDTDKCKSVSGYTTSYYQTFGDDLSSLDFVLCMQKQE